MSQGLTKGEKPTWNTSSRRAGATAMDHVADSARATRIKGRKAAKVPPEPRKGR